MLIKFIRDAIVVVVGKQAEPIADLLDGKKYINEFLIAKKLGLTINQTRNILYKISDHGLVSSIRKKDKRKGWYTYFWRLEVLKALEFLKEILSKKIENGAHQIKSRETNNFYVCPLCHVEYNEENALLHDFTCPECGEVFAKSDNSKILKDLKREEARMKKEMEMMDEEIGKEREVGEKKRTKEKNKIEKEKKEKRRNAFLLRKKEKGKLAAKTHHPGKKAKISGKKKKSVKKRR